MKTVNLPETGRLTQSHFASRATRCWSKVGLSFVLHLLSWWRFLSPPLQLLSPGKARPFVITVPPVQGAVVSTTVGAQHLWVSAQQLYGFKKVTHILAQSRFIVKWEWWYPDSNLDSVTCWLCFLELQFPCLWDRVKSYWVGDIHKDVWKCPAKIPAPSWHSLTVHFPPVLGNLAFRELTRAYRKCLG